MFFVYVCYRHHRVLHIQLLLHGKHLNVCVPISAGECMILGIFSSQLSSNDYKRQVREYYIYYVLKRITWETLFNN